jgi:hypothetical protein
LAAAPADDTSPVFCTGASFGFFSSSGLIETFFG